MNSPALERDLAQAVAEIRAQYGDGPEVPDEIIANTFAAQRRAVEIGLERLPRLLTVRSRLKLRRLDRAQRRRLDRFVRNFLAS